MIPVFWFLGLSASGKSTLSEICCEYLKANAELFPNVSKWELLDGDRIRKFMGTEIGYSYSDRRKSVRLVGLMAKTLSDNGIGVVVANISPFHDLRIFMEGNISGYKEIYCKCSIDECIKRDPKGHYMTQLYKGIKDYVGLDIPFQEPQRPDLTLDTEILSIEQSEDVIKNYIKLLAENPEK